MTSRTWHKFSLTLHQKATPLGIIHYIGTESDFRAIIFGYPELGFILFPLAFLKRTDCYNKVGFNDTSIKKSFASSSETNSLFPTKGCYF
jgi:hypothetical protein